MALAAARAAAIRGTARGARGAACRGDPGLRVGGDARLQLPRHRTRAVDAVCSAPGTVWRIADLLDDAAGQAARLPARGDPAVLGGVGHLLLPHSPIIPAARGTLVSDRAAILPDTGFGHGLVCRRVSTVRTEGAHRPGNRESGDGRTVAGAVLESALLCAGHRAGAASGDARRAISEGEVRVSD